jgi:hypothetical protein
LHCAFFPVPMLSHSLRSVTMCFLIMADET